MKFIMEIKDFIQHFAEQFDDTDVSMFSPETRFKELDDWNSLTALSIIAMVDEEYGVSINSDNIRSAQTVGDLFKQISDLK